jgi:cytoskeletal protein CcmA (bactofilin family)
VGIWKRRPWTLRAAPPPPRPAAEVERPPADFLQPPQPLRALLGHDSEVTGKLGFSGPTRIDGRLRGEVRGTDLLLIGESGYVHGTIRASALVVLGCVEGDVVCTERVEIGPHGVLQGNVETRALVVHDGGQLDGDIRVSPPPRATVHVLHPRGEAETSA